MTNMNFELSSAITMGVFSATVNISLLTSARSSETLLDCTPNVFFTLCANAVCVWGGGGGGGGGRGGEGRGGEGRGGEGRGGEGRGGEGRGGEGRGEEGEGEGRR